MPEQSIGENNLNKFCDTNLSQICGRSTRGLGKKGVNINVEKLGYSLFCTKGLLLERNIK